MLIRVTLISLSSRQGRPWSDCFIRWWLKKKKKKPVKIPPDGIVWICVWNKCMCFIRTPLVFYQWIPYMLEKRTYADSMLIMIIMVLSFYCVHFFPIKFFLTLIHQIGRYTVETSTQNAYKGYHCSCEIIICK